MKLTLGAAAALFALAMAAPVSAEEPVGPIAAEPMVATVQPMSADECTFEGEAPTMPDPETATEEDVTSTFSAIKAYQTALEPYRKCLNTVIDNKELDSSVRQAALDKFNATVDAEEALVKAWGEFYKAYKAKKNGNND